MPGRGRELDQWARALGASNDAEAIRALKPLSGHLSDGLYAARRVEDVIVRGPEGDPEGLRSVLADMAWLAGRLEQIEGKFRMHERGGD